MSRILKHKVGYARPPRDRRWKKGQSGNPSGRPKGHQNLATVLAAALSETTTVKTANGRPRTMTKLEAATRQLVDQAVEGDPRVIGQLLGELHKNEAQLERNAAGDTLDPVDEEVLKALYARLARDALAKKGVTGSVLARRLKATRKDAR